MNLLVPLICCLLLPAAAVGRSIQPFIIGGSRADIRNHRHQLSLRISMSMIHICGASLFSTTRAVTSAHCLGSAPSTYTIVGGTSDLNDTNCIDCVRRTCDRAVRHPNYSGSGGYPNDVGVIGFPSVTLTDKIGLIVLASPNDGDFAGRNCVITGWGLTRIGGNLSNDLYQASMSVLTTAACILLWGADNIDQDQICVRSSTSSACNGDSGGPLVCTSKLAGIISWNMSNCSPIYPTVCSRVSSYYYWIREQ